MPLLVNVSGDVTLVIPEMLEGGVSAVDASMHTSKAAFAALAGVNEPDVTLGGVAAATLVRTCATTGAVGKPIVDENSNISQHAAVTDPPVKGVCVALSLAPAIFHAVAHFGAFDDVSSSVQPVLAEGSVPASHMTARSRSPCVGAAPSVTAEEVADPTADCESEMATRDVPSRDYSHFQKPVPESFDNPKQVVQLRVSECVVT